MVMDALRGYVQLANGLTEVTKQRAQQAAKALLHQTGAEALTTNLTTKVSDLADEIVATSKSNRQLLQAIVANEVEGAVARLGFVRAEEVAALTRRLERMERDLAEARDAAAAPAARGAGPAGDQLAEALEDDWDEPLADTGAVRPVKKAAAKKTAAKKTAAKKTAAKKVAKQAAAKKAARQVPAKKAAKKAATKKA